jgi:hypothetical protein
MAKGIVSAIQMTQYGNGWFLNYCPLAGENGAVWPVTTSNKSALKGHADENEDRRSVGCGWSVVWLCDDEGSGAFQAANFGRLDGGLQQIARRRLSRSADDGTLRMRTLGGGLTGTFKAEKSGVLVEDSAGRCELRVRRDGATWAAAHFNPKETYPGGAPTTTGIAVKQQAASRVMRAHGGQKRRVVPSQGCQESADGVTPM